MSLVFDPQFEIVPEIDDAEDDTGSESSSTDKSEEALVENSADAPHAPEEAPADDAPSESGELDESQDISDDPPDGGIDEAEVSADKLG